MWPRDCRTRPSSPCRPPATRRSAPDASDCTLLAITRFLERRNPRATCQDPPAPLAVDAPVPLSLDAVGEFKRAPESVARVLTAVNLTLDDVEAQGANQAIIAFSNDIDGPVSGGGLRAGRFRIGTQSTAVSGVVFVPGVRVTGRLLNRAARIGSFRVSAGGKRGTIRYRGGGLITGKFDGRSFRVKLPRDNTPPTISLGKRTVKPVWPRPAR